MKRSKERMFIVLGVIVLTISLVIIYFNIPYSRLRNDFNNCLAESAENTKNNNKYGKYTINNLPKAIQRFYTYTGLEKNTYSNHVSFDFKNADFVNIEMNKELKIDYSEHIFGGIPARFAFIDSSIYGIPFQGLDSLMKGNGKMKGVVAKNFTVFNQSGVEMDKSTLVTWLAEIIFMPSELLSGNIEINELDNNTVKVSIKYEDLEVSGIYKFKDSGEVVEFSTDDRAISYNDGSFVKRKWSALFEDYTSKGELLLPNRLKAVWHSDNEDLTYFDGKNIEYNFFTH